MSIIQEKKYPYFLRGTKRLIVFPILLIISLHSTQSAVAQKQLSYRKAKAKLVKTLNASSTGDLFAANVNWFYKSACDSLIKTRIKVGGKPIKKILTRLFTVCNEKIKSGKINTLRIPSLNQNFLFTLNAYKDESIFELYRSINLTQIRILYSVFFGLEPGYRIQTFLGLREMANDPYLIASRIELPQYAAYKDSLIFILANGAPEILVAKLNEKDTLYTDMVSRSNRKSVNAISRLRMDPEFDRLKFFGMALLNNSITKQDIDSLLLVPAGYYHAFTTEIVRLHNSSNEEENEYLKVPLVEQNRQLANHYFIKSINDLHELPGNIRFKAVEPLAALELYLILVADNGELVIGGSSALYTSSFLYVFNEFIKKLKTEGAEKFLDRIGYYQFNQFLSNISDYGLVEELVANIEEQKMGGLLLKYLSRFSNKKLTDNEIILRSMTAAQILYEVNDHPKISRIVLAGIEDMMARPQQKNYLMYQRMYSGLRDILLDKDAFDSEAAYDKLQVERLQHKGMIVQACFFYDDDDGEASFNNSVASYSKTVWQKEDLGNYVLFSSVTGHPMKVYMNKPNTTIGYDAAQNEMLDQIKRKGYVVSSFVHRGHSYYLSESIKKMSSSGELVFLGSCGGYNQVLKIFELNPDANIISTRGVGSTIINDPLLGKINTLLVKDNDINWDDLWKKLEVSFRSEYAQDLFTSYVAPNRYIGVKFIRKVLEY